MKITTEINGIDLKNGFNIVTVSLTDVVIYDLIQFTAKLHIKDNKQEFEKVQNSIIQVINKNGSTDYDLNIIFELIEKTKDEWINHIQE